MANLSRRSLVMMTAWGVLVPGTAKFGEASLEENTLQCILTGAHFPNDNANCVYLLEYPAIEGARCPSAQLLSGSRPMPTSITATPDRWRLSNGQRITMLDRNFTVSIQRKVIEREA